MITSDVSSHFVREAIALDTKAVFVKKIYGVDIPEDRSEWPRTISHMRFNEGIISDYLQSINLAAIFRGTIKLSDGLSVKEIHMGRMLDNHRAASPGYVTGLCEINTLSPLSQGVPIGSSPKQRLKECHGLCGLCDRKCEPGERSHPTFQNSRPSRFLRDRLICGPHVKWICRGEDHLGER